MNKNEIKKRLILFFSQMDCTPTANREGESHNLLTFKKINDEIAVHLLDGGLPEKNILLKTLMNASTTIHKYNLTYIAVPKVYASLVDAMILERQGAGLLTYDNHSIEEVLAPKYSETTIENSPESTSPAIIDEVDSLKLRLDSLQRTVERLSEEITQLKARGVGSTSEVSFEKPVIIKERSTENGDVPGYLKNNPWITILSQRGQE
ncbi:hypothetical protein [[Eubacterium] cellulosolvens]